MEIIWLALVFITLLALRCPVAHAMILSSAVSLWMSGLPLGNISQKLASGVDSFPLLAIPLFILAGSLMNTLGITERIFGLASALVGHIPGGLAHVNVVASVIFAGMSGSAIADAGGLGAVEMKAMNDAGYPRELSAAITAASATIGPVVPPSIAMVIYAFIAEQSLGALFLAGILPGLLMAALMMLLIYVASKRGHYDLPALPRASRTKLGSAFRRAFLPLLAPTILVGGILFGIFTPTEAGVVVVVYVLLVGVVFLKFEIGHIRDTMMDTVRTSAATLFIIAASMIFGWIVVVYRVSDKTLALLSAHIDSPSTVMLFIVISMMVLGMFLEGIPVPGAHGADVHDAGVQVRHRPHPPGRGGGVDDHAGSPHASGRARPLHGDGDVGRQDPNARQSAVAVLHRVVGDDSHRRLVSSDLSLASPFVARVRNVSFENVRDEFPIKRERVYLNNASIGPCSRRVTAAVTEFLSEVQMRGRRNYPNWCRYVDETARARAARLIGAEPSEIAWVPNTTQGICLVANGLEWRNGDNVIIADIEYPSNVYPWMNLKDRGVEVRWIEASDGRIETSAIEKLIDRRTRLISLSSVQFANGFRLDLDGLCELRDKHGVLVHLDAIQHLGALAMDVSAHPVDFLSAGGHKWLLGPIGSGIFYCRSGSLEQLKQGSVGRRLPHCRQAAGSFGFRVDPTPRCGPVRRSAREFSRNLRSRRGYRDDSRVRRGTRGKPHPRTGVVGNRRIEQVGFHRVELDKGARTLGNRGLPTPDDRRRRDRCQTPRQ